jgi:hypothetical protein
MVAAHGGTVLFFDVARAHTLRDVGMVGLCLALVAGFLLAVRGGGEPSARDTADAVAARLEPAAQEVEAAAAEVAGVGSAAAAAVPASGTEPVMSSARAERLSAAACPPAD